MIAITLLTQSSCIYCDQAKEILSRLAADYPLNVREVGLDTEEGRNLAIRHAVMFAPGVLMNDSLFSYGRLSEKKLRLYFSQNGTKRMEG